MGYSGGKDSTALYLSPEVALRPLLSVVFADALVVGDVGVAGDCALAFVERTTGSSPPICSLTVSPEFAFRPLLSGSVAALHIDALSMCRRSLRSGLC